MATGSRVGRWIVIAALDLGATIALLFLVEGCASGVGPAAAGHGS